MKKGIFGLERKDVWLWGASVCVLLLTYTWLRGNGVVTLTASIVGVTSLIFNAKGNPFGQILMIGFSLLYGFISYTFSYYGEMLTYLGMTMPMSVFSLISWLKHPYHGKRAQVSVGKISHAACGVVFFITLWITVLFYFVLKYFQTANLFWSTVSVATSFLAVSFTFLRSPYYAVAYAANDFVLIVLWLYAARYNPSYYSTVVCFCIFFVNDLYGFFCWKNMEKQQVEK